MASKDGSTRDKRRMSPDAVRSSGFKYANRELLRYVLNPAFLCKRWDWYEGFLMQNEMRRQALRRSGFTARYDSRLGGYNRTREDRAQASIPSLVLNIMLLADPELDTDEKKFEQFLIDFPEFSLEVKV